MKQKTLIILSSILVPLLLVGVGFSTYAITNAVTASGTGTLTAEDVNSKKISVTMNPVVFDTSAGFIDNSTHLVSTNSGTLTANVTFTGFSGKEATFLFDLSEPTSVSLISNIEFSCTSNDVTAESPSKFTPTESHHLKYTVAFSNNNNSLPENFSASLSYTLPAASSMVEAELTLTVTEQ